MTSVSGLISLLITLIIVGAVLYIIWWAMTQIPMPEPIRVVTLVVFVLIVLLIALKFLLPLAGVSLL